MTTAITTSQAAERLQVPLSTLKAWLDRLDLPLPLDSRGRRLLDARALAVLETVRTLRDRDLGYETIRRKLAEEGVPVGGQPAPPGEEPVPTIAAIIGPVQAAVEDALARQAFMAQAYAEASREIGRLEERVATLQDQLAAKDADIRRLARELASSQGDDHVSLAVEPGARPAWKFWG